MKIKNIYDDKPQISVILTIYGLEYSQKFETTIKALKKQTIDLEIIICEQGLNPNYKIKEFCEANQVRYIHTLPDIKDGKVIYNIGRVRNVAASLSNGEYLYFNDIDILIHDTRYFEQLLNYCKNINDIPLFRPKMRRLSEETSDNLVKDYLSDVEIDYKIKDATCLVNYNDIKHCIDVIDEGENYCIINNLQHVTSKEIFKKGINYEFDSNKIEEFAWKTTFHCGGTFCKFSHFIEIGGFCEGYHNWGLEDIDFQRKLNEKIGIQFIDNVVFENSVIHFEHQGRYNNILYKLNREVFENRIKQGIYSLCESDRHREDTFMGNYISGNLEFLNKFFTNSECITFRAL